MFQPPKTFLDEKNTVSQPPKTFLDEKILCHNPQKLFLMKKVQCFNLKNWFLEEKATVFQPSKKTFSTKKEAIHFLKKGSLNFRLCIHHSNSNHVHYLTNSAS